ncbi:MAG: hypothetical protein MUE50_08785 [Pirellulaceae bacterium]|nr:hypothetical protein [Pirellulaceae bacterium]
MLLQEVRHPAQHRRIARDTRQRTTQAVLGQLTLGILLQPHQRCRPRLVRTTWFVPRIAILAREQEQAIANANQIAGLEHRLLDGLRIDERSIQAPAVLQGPVIRAMHQSRVQAADPIIVQSQVTHTLATNRHCRNLRVKKQGRSRRRPADDN